MDVVQKLQGFHQRTVSLADALRAVVAHPAWHVPLDERGAVELTEDDGVVWYVAWAEAPQGPHVKLDGRALVRGVPEGAGGVLLEPDTDHAVTFRRPHFGKLLEVADAVELADALLHPRPGRASTLHTALWWAVPGPDGRPIVRSFPSGQRLVPLFTGADTAERWVRLEPDQKDAELRAFAGPELFAGLAARDDHDGVVFDAGSAGIPAVGPDFAGALADGVDPRPGASILPARTVAEIHLWLDLMGAEREGRKHTVVQRPDGLCAVYDVRWRRTDWGKPAFDLTEPRPDPEDLGDGPSRILCAGLLVDAVRVRLGGFADDPAGMAPEERPHAALGARWLWELEKLLEGDRIPRAALRTAEGAKSFRERPECTSRGWVLAQRRRAEALAGTV